MKKKLFALLIAGVMAMSVNAFAAETELTEEMTTESAADTSTVVLQGLDDNGITWTLALNAENAMGCVVLTPEGDEKHILQERLRLVMAHLQSQMRKTDRITNLDIRMFHRQKRS